MHRLPLVVARGVSRVQNEVLPSPRVSELGPLLLRRSRRNSGSTSTGICSSTRRRFDDAFCSSTRRLAFCSSPRRLAFCSSTQRRDDDATTTQRRRDGSTRGAGGGPLQPIASSATVLGPRSLGGYRVLTRRARELPRGVTSHPKDTGMTPGQDVRRNKHAPQDDHSYAAPLGLRVLPVAISHGDPPGARPPERRGEGQAHSSAIQLVHSGLQSLRGRTTDS